MRVILTERCKLTSLTVLVLLCPHLSPAWYQLLISSSSPDLAPVPRPELTRGNLAGVGVPENLENLLYGDMKI